MLSQRPSLPLEPTTYTVEGSTTLHQTESQTTSSARSTFESQEHVLVHCPAYIGVRARFLTNAGVGVLDVSTILDHSNSTSPDVEVEELTQMYCQTIHCHRQLKLNAL